MIPARSIGRPSPLTLGKVHKQFEKPSFSVQIGRFVIPNDVRHGFCETRCKRGRDIPKQHGQTGSTMIIAGTGRISVNADAVRDGDITTRSAGTALVPIIAPVERPPVSRFMARHDAFFVTQLIAMAQHSPQTRVFAPRRAAGCTSRLSFNERTESRQRTNGPTTAARRLNPAVRL